ncbi:MAG: hypothetical protein AAGK66_08210, partial [Pseudomonadota bacterium]
AGNEGSDQLRSQSSEVVILAHNDAALAKFERDDRWKELVADGGRAWTDDYSNVIGAIWDHTF